MHVSSGKRQRPRTTPLQTAIQILGFAGTSHLLHFAIELFPFYETSRLADVPPLFRDGDPWALAGALLQFALIPAVLEELIFRGALPLSGWVSWTGLPWDMFL